MVAIYDPKKREPVPANELKGTMTPNQKFQRMLKAGESSGPTPIDQAKQAHQTFVASPVGQDLVSTATPIVGRIMDAGKEGGLIGGVRQFGEESLKGFQKLGDMEIAGLKKAEEAIRPKATAGAYALGTAIGGPEWGDAAVDFLHKRPFASGGQSSVAIPPNVKPEMDSRPEEQPVVPPTEKEPMTININRGRVEAKSSPLGFTANEMSQINENIRRRNRGEDVVPVELDPNGPQLAGYHNGVQVRGPDAYRGIESVDPVQSGITPPDGARVHTAGRNLGPNPVMGALSASSVAQPSTPVITGEGTDIRTEAPSVAQRINNEPVVSSAAQVAAAPQIGAGRRGRVYGYGGQLNEPETGVITGTPSVPMPRMSEWAKERDRWNAKVGAPSDWDRRHMSDKEYKTAMEAHQTGIDSVEDRIAKAEGLDAAEAEAGAGRQSDMQIAQINAAAKGQADLGDRVRLAQLERGIAGDLYKRGRDERSDRRADSEERRKQNDYINKSFSNAQTSYGIPDFTRGVYSEIFAKYPDIQPQLVGGAIQAALQSQTGLLKRYNSLDQTNPTEAKEAREIMDDIRAKAFEALQ